MSKFRNLPRFVVAAFLPMDPQNFDKVSDKLKMKNRKDDIVQETGWDRLKQMFRVDEVEGISNELNSIHQAGLCGFLIGIIYGGVLHSKKAYVDFMENNVASTFKSHLDAKRKLQDQVTMSFAKGAFRWGWRLGLFTTSYVGIITCISVYREKSSIYEYLIAGGMTGAMYKINLGLRGVLAGGIIGSCFGGIAGTVSLIIMKLSGTSMEEVRYWQYKWKLARNQAVQEAFQAESESDPVVFQHHDSKVNNISLSAIEAEQPKESQ